IMSYLPPLDLLHLARVSNDFRQMLMTRSIKWLWEISLRRYDPSPPPCPDYLSMPEYVSVLFEKVCMV
ncbi:uncharacterized protein BXZ73DRAFT_1024, partial [Epithele typhae]|uniref:uncharacterized protein n=1 Tax=Epithele typhae TaxID=378194 RepID=UPI002008512B